MRTEQEIKQRFVQALPKDPLAFEAGEYTRAMSAETLEQLKGDVIKADADLSEHEPDLTSDEALRKQCINYMPFAWDKANGCRGISAGRSLSHYKAWLWMMGEDGFEGIDDYQFYGKDELARICEYLGLDAAQWDDGIRSNTEY